jgi:hypothetical protein
MIGFVDLAHPDFLADPARRQGHLGHRLNVTLRLQEVAGTPCLYQHYSAIDRAFVRRWGLRALVLSGIPSHWRAYDWATFAPLAALIREPEVPILGVCGGSQVIGRLLGAPVTLMGRLQPGEIDTGTYMAGWRKEVGFLPLDTETTDPLFAGLGPHPSFYLDPGVPTRRRPDLRHPGTSRALRRRAPGWAALAGKLLCAGRDHPATITRTFIGMASPAVRETWLRAPLRPKAWIMTTHKD